ncbi:hypothetical protein [Rhizosaccharibacter radicis]|uniref:Uncharacterized protein n=1 Tax=Rhizosaccharibacter radicis TaxID=2782605 RepID=A0ABT1VVN2_9PROT|nr:hypothetical protein [Acetobacteraceae bacterium KSS12]
MKSILKARALQASVCAAALAFAVPAIAQTDSGDMHKGKMHSTHHHMGKMGKMHGGKGYKTAINPTTEDLNAKSLAAARSGTDATAGAPGAAAAPAPAGGGMAQPGAMAPAGSGTPATTAPAAAPAPAGQ